MESLFCFEILKPDHLERNKQRCKVAPFRVNICSTNKKLNTWPNFWSFQSLTGFCLKQTKTDLKRGEEEKDW